MKVFGLIGYPLQHSFSAGYFAEKFRRENILDCIYKNFPIPEIENFLKLIDEEPELFGLNVTIPWKRAVIPFLHDLDETAREVGAVNTINIQRGYSIVLRGYNTDVYGFERSLLPILKPGVDRALVLGSGGASQAVKYTLRKLGITFIPAGRDEDGDKLGYKSVTPSMIKETPLIINTTPLGTMPDVDTCPPIPYEALTPHHFLYDLVYNPPETRFLREGKERGAKVKNGYEMLILQAEKAWEIWNTFL